MTRYEVISDAAALTKTCADWRHAPWLAIDTEFLREDTYHSQLCLVQIGDGQRNVCIDVIAIGLDHLQPMWDLLLKPSILKVLHAASQDFEIFVRFAGQAIRPLFDTQVAAALLGDGDQLGYAGLVEKRLGVKLDKSLTRTNWSRRPLTDAELTYAADDVRWLAELYPLLRDELITRGRLEWLEEDCERMSDPARYANPPEQAWRRLKGLARLPAAAQPIAVALAGWREVEAQVRDRPRKWIIDDETIYRMADRRPVTERQLGEIGLPQKTVERHGDALLSLVASPPQTMDALVDAGLLDDIRKTQLKRLQEQLRITAEELGLPATLIAPRADVEALVRHGANAHVTLLQGWRRQQVGDALLNRLAESASVWPSRG